MIFKWDRWLDKTENRISTIDLKTFKILLEKNCFKNKFIHKKIYQPTFKIGFFKKCRKITESYFSTYIKNTINDNTYPLRENSLVCYNYIENGDGVDFLIFPYKDSLFTISPLKESSHIQTQEYKKGYWKDRIKWLENLSENELWTDGNCLIIEKKIYDKIFEYNDYKNSDYSITDRNILATTLIGEAGGNVAEMKKVMNVLNNRAKNKKSTPKKEALRPMQFSMWNSAFQKEEKELESGKIKKVYKLKSNQHLSNIIKKHKMSQNWGKKHWEAAYKIVDNNFKSKIEDSTFGANLYYAISLESKNKKPYWAKLKNWKETVRTKYHAYGKLI